MLSLNDICAAKLGRFPGYSNGTNSSRDILNPDEEKSKSRDKTTSVEPDLICIRRHHPGSRNAISHSFSPLHQSGARRAAVEVF